MAEKHLQYSEKDVGAFKTLTSIEIEALKKVADEQINFKMESELYISK